MIPMEVKYQLETLMLHMLQTIHLLLLVKMEIIKSIPLEAQTMYL